MSSSDNKGPAGRANDEYAWIDRYAADLHRSAKELVAEQAQRAALRAAANVPDFLGPNPLVRPKAMEDEKEKEQP